MYVSTCVLKVHIFMESMHCRIGKSIFILSANCSGSTEFENITAFKCGNSKLLFPLQMYEHGSPPACFI